MSTTGSAAQTVRAPRQGSGNLLGLQARRRERAVGGLLGVVGSEAWQGARGGFEQGGLVTQAMLDLCRSYIQHGRPTPLEVARRYEGVPAPAWLLPVAIVHHDKRAVLSDALELAITAGVPRSALNPCVAYVELAWELFQGRAVREAVKAATGQHLSPARSGPPMLCGMAPVDGLTAGIWVLGQHGKLCDLATSLADYTEPWVAAAAAGVLGMRDGCVSVPAQWFRSVAGADACVSLAEPLLSARQPEPCLHRMAIAR